MKQKKQYTGLLALNALLAAGLVCHSVILLAVNKTLPFPGVAGDPGVFGQRAFWQGAAQFICSLLSAAYLIGHICTAYFYLRARRYLPLRQVLPYFLAQLLIMFLGTVPFALFDRASWGNYLWPLWGPPVEMLAILAIYSVICFVMRKRIKSGKHEG